MAIDGTLRAIADPRRREILRLVWRQEMTAGEIATHFDVTRPAVSQHLTILKEVGLISERREGVRRFYRARPETLAEVRTYLDEFWQDRLVALKREAELAEREGARSDRDDREGLPRDRDAH